MSKAQTENKTEYTDFSAALIRLKAKQRLARKFWPNGTFIFMVEGSKFAVNRAPLNAFYREGAEIEYAPHLDMNTAEGRVQVWQLTQDDVFATDWYIVN